MARTISRRDTLPQNMAAAEKKIAHMDRPFPTAEEFLARGMAAIKKEYLVSRYDKEKEVVADAAPKTGDDEQKADGATLNNGTEPGKRGDGGVDKNRTGKSRSQLKKVRASLPSLVFTASNSTRSSAREKRRLGEGDVPKSDDVLQRCVRLCETPAPLKTTSSLSLSLREPLDEIISVMC